MLQNQMGVLAPVSGKRGKLVFKQGCLLAKCFGVCCKLLGSLGEAFGKALCYCLHHEGKAGGISEVVGIGVAMGVRVVVRGESLPFFQRWDIFSRVYDKPLQASEKPGIKKGLIALSA